MIKKLTCLIAACTLALSLAATVNAAESAHNILVDFYERLPKVQFQTHTYGWAEVGVAEQPTFTDGALGGMIQDFDADGQPELAVIQLVHSTNEETYVAAQVEMYEANNGTAALIDTTEPMAVITKYTDRGGMECFVKDGRIVLQCGSDHNTFSDGTDQRIHVYDYNGRLLSLTQVIELGGSFLDTDAAKQLAEKFAVVDLNDTQSLLNTGDFHIPYFGSHSEPYFNLAVIEKNISRICAFYIDNNYDTLSYKLDQEDWSTFVVREGKMTILYHGFVTLQREMSILLNGSALTFPQPPYIEGGTTMVPMRAIFEALGAQVGYDGATGTITADKDGTKILLSLGSADAVVNGQAVKLSVAAANKNGSAMVPLRFISEALGAEVQWDAASYTVSITQK